MSILPRLVFKRATAITLCVTFFTQILFANSSPSTIWIERRPWVSASSRAADAVTPLKIPTHSVIAREKNPQQKPLRTLFVLEDIHMNSQAQRTVSTTLMALMKDKKIDIVGIEGEFIPYDFSRFDDLDQPEITKKICLNFLNRNFISGAAYAGIVARSMRVPFLGVDDAQLYWSNVHAYRKARRIQPKLATAINSQRQRWLGDLQRHASPSLREFEYTKWLWETDRLPLFTYLRYLKADAPASGQIARLLKAQQIQKQLSQLKNVKDPALLSKFSEFEKNIYSDFSSSLLKDEIKIAEERARKILATHAADKLLIKRHDALTIYEKLIDFRMEPTDRAPESRNGTIAPFVEFYQLADQRTDAIVSNLLRTPWKRAALVVGGYHTDRLVKKFNESAVSVVVLTPLIKNAKRKNASAYLRSFDNQDSPFQSIERASAQTLSNNLVVGVGASSPFTGVLLGILQRAQKNLPTQRKPVALMLAFAAAGIASIGSTLQSNLINTTSIAALLNAVFPPVSVLIAFLFLTSKQMRNPDVGFGRTAITVLPYAGVIIGCLIGQPYQCFANGTMGILVASTLLVAIRYVQSDQDRPFKPLLLRDAYINQPLVVLALLSIPGLLNWQQHLNASLEYGLIIALSVGLNLWAAKYVSAETREKSQQFLRVQLPPTLARILIPTLIVADWTVKILVTPHAKLLIKFHAGDHSLYWILIYHALLLGVWILSFRSWINLGTILMISGYLSNAIEKYMWRGALDPFRMLNPTANLADIYQWIGISLIANYLYHLILNWHPWKDGTNSKERLINIFKTYVLPKPTKMGTWKINVAIVFMVILATPSLFYGRQRLSEIPDLRLQELEVDVDSTLDIKTRLLKATEGKIILGVGKEISREATLSLEQLLTDAKEINWQQIRRPFYMTYGLGKDNRPHIRVDGIMVPDSLPIAPLIQKHVSRIGETNGEITEIWLGQLHSKLRGRAISSLEQHKPTSDFFDSLAGEMWGIMRHLKAAMLDPDSVSDEQIARWRRRAKSIEQGLLAYDPADQWPTGPEADGILTQIKDTIEPPTDVTTLKTSFQLPDREVNTGA